MDIVLNDSLQGAGQLAGGACSCLSASQAAKVPDKQPGCLTSCQGVSQAAQLRTPAQYNTNINLYNTLSAIA